MFDSIKPYFKWQEKDRTQYVFCVFFLGMAVYYGYRMFTITPWYDELYTYYYFISRGPVYAAIHWPLPNNHVGYSALSACFIIFGSAAVALRGVSWLCSLGSVVLLYRIGRKCFAGYFALIPMFIFTGMSMVNQLAVQGRGYALVTFCYLTAIWELLHIAVEHRKKIRDYVVFGLSLVLALWAIPSSLYVVMPLCILGGIVLLSQKEYRILIQLIAASLVSAFVTAGLYGILWLAIGSNLLIKTPDSGFGGMSHGAVILQAPIKALITGVTYMLDTPYIQSMTREQFRRQASYWRQTLFGTQLSPVVGVKGAGMCWLVGVALTVVILWSIGRLKQRITGDDREKYREFLAWYFILTPLLLTVALIIQCKLPYQRVFSFLGAWTAFLTAWLFETIDDIARKKSDEKKGNKASVRRLGRGWGILTGGLCVLALWADQNPYSMRDEFLRDAYEQVPMEQMEKVAVTDCDQEYFLLYAYDIEGDRVTRQIEEADIVLIDKALLGMTYSYRESPEEWKFYLTREEIPTAYLEEKMEPVYENWHFILYERK